jgi:type IV secretion system protein VirB10
MKPFGFAALTARLKSRPDTELTKLGVFPQPVTPFGFAALTARLKSRPDTELTKLGVFPQPVTPFGFAAFSARLKSRPDTKLTKLGIFPQPVKPFDFAAFTARLNSRPDTELTKLGVFPQPVARWSAAILVLALTAGSGLAAQQTSPPSGPVSAPGAGSTPSTPAAAPPATPANSQAPAAPPKYVVPSGTKVLLSLKSGINTKTAKPGDGVYLVSSFPVVIDGHVLIPDGAYVQGVIDRVKRPGRVKGRAEISMHFTSIIFPNGQVVPIPGMVNSLPGSDGPKVTGDEGTVQQASNAGHDVGTVAKGAGIGAEGGVIGGAVSGNPVAGLAYGSLAGAATAAVYTLLSRGPDISIPAGSSVEMILQRPMSLEAQQFAVVNDAPPQEQQQYNPLPQRPPLTKPN